jgi:hypothetical protein
MIARRLPWHELDFQFHTDDGRGAQRLKAGDERSIAGTARFHGGRENPL